MRKGRYVAALLVLLGARAEGEFWPRLEPGAHAVGFRVVRAVDDSRQRGEAGRVIRIFIWYPAAHASRGAPVTWRDYLRGAADETAFPTPDTMRGDRQLNELREAALAAGAVTSRIDALLDQTTLARHDARSAGGHPPLVVFVPGFGAQAFQNTVACEYLASRGFVVASFPSEGRDSGEMTGDATGVAAQVSDISFVVHQVQQQMRTDPRRVGVFGYSWGGLTATFAAMRGLQLAAVVAIDPTLLVSRGHQQARTFDGYEPAKLAVPFMAMIADAGAWKERDLTFLAELTATRPILVRFHDLKHGDFVSIILRFLVHALPEGGKRDLGKLDAGYAAECRYLEAFFDAHLRDGKHGKAFLSGRSPFAGVTLER